MCPSLRVVRRTLLATAIAAAAASPAVAQPLAPVEVTGAAREIACGPRAAVAPPEPGLIVTGAAAGGRMIFGPGDIVALNAGSAHGLKPGDEFFTRRTIVDRYEARSRTPSPVAIHTTGWLRVVEVRTDRASAAVVHACDAIEEGDYLEPFAVPDVPVTAAGAQADFEHPARVLFGDEGRQMGSAGAFMMLDRGRAQGLAAGQRLTVFRAPFDGGPIERVAEATVIVVGEEFATIRIDSSRDAVYVGDRAAVHR